MSQALPPWDRAWPEATRGCPGAAPPDTGAAAQLTDKALSALQSVPHLLQCSGSVCWVFLSAAGGRKGPTCQVTGAAGGPCHAKATHPALGHKQASLLSYMDFRDIKTPPREQHRKQCRVSSKSQEQVTGC